MYFIITHFKQIILGAAAVVGVILLIKYYQKIKKFLSEVKVELGKVSWSTRQELMGSTVVVIAITALIAIFIFLADFLLSFGLRLLFH